MSSPRPTRSWSFSGIGLRLACILAAALAALGGCKSTPSQGEKAAKKPASAPAATQATTQPDTQPATQPGTQPTSRRTTQAQIDEAQFRADLDALTQNDNRLAGREDGSLAAGNYVRQRLLDMGFRQDAKADEALFVQDFPVVQPRMTSCEMVVDGKSYPILPMRPNLLQAAVTPAEGIVGRTVYAGSGTVPEYGNQLVHDRIVVLDFDCHAGWLNAFAFGARAVLFLGQDVPGGPGGALGWSGSPAQFTFHHVGVPANLPRFYVPRKVADELRLREAPRNVKLVASCQWEELRARNIIALLRGTDPKFPGDRPPQAMVLAAPLDSYSEVPDLAPAARDAASCAALLQITRHLKLDRPRRDMVLCFFDGEALGHMGSRFFYGALYRKVDRDAFSLEERLEMFQDEREFMQIATIVLEQDEVFVKPSEAELEAKLAQAEDPDRKRLLSQPTKIRDYHKDVVLWLRSEARIQGSEVLDELRPVRLKIKELSSGPTADTPATKARITELEQLRDELTIEDLSWNSIQRIIHDNVDTRDKDKVEKLFQDVQDPQMRRKLQEVTPLRFKELLAITGKLARRRIAELDQLIEENSQATALRDAVGQDKSLIVLHTSINLGDAGARWTFVHGDDSMPLYQDSLGNYTAIFKTMREVDRRLGPALTVEDIRDWKGFCQALKADGKEDKSQFGRRMWDALPDKARETAERIANGDSVKDSEREDLVKAITDKALGNREFLPKAVLESMPLSPADKALLAAPVDQLWDQDVQRLNRLVLDGRFSGLVHPTPPERLLPGFDVRGVSQTYEGRLFAPGEFADSTAMARIFAVFNVSMMTVMDPLSRQGQPADTLAALNWKNVLLQARQAAPFLKDLADRNGLNVASPIRPDARYAETEWTSARITGASVRRVGTGSALRAHPERDAVVAVVNRERWRSTDPQRVPPGLVNCILVKTNTNGSFEIAPFNFTHLAWGYLVAAKFDSPPKAGAATRAGARSRGLIASVTASDSLAKNSPIKAAVMLCHINSMSLVGYGYDRGVLPTMAMRALSTAQFQPDRHMVAEYGNVLTVFAPYDATGLKLFNRAGMVILNNRDTKSDYQGIGIPLNDPFEHPVTTERTARDLRTLNEYRLGLLRNNRINQESLEILNNRAKEMEYQADESVKPGPDRKGLDWYFGTLSASAAISRRVYRPLVNVLNDLVTAVVLLLLLAVPFAYSLERLLIGSPHIYRQIGWFTVFFVLTFALLYTVNPAFRIAATPVIIFLAFAIIVLSALVIFIMVRKLQTEIRKVQGLATTVHSMDVSRLSTMMAAVNMGISTMRRRSLRTLLTATTVVLLTFTILTFASFGSSWGNRRTYQGPMSGPPRILVRHMLWSPLSDEIHEQLRGHLSGEADVIPRYWVSPTAQEAQDAMKSGQSLEMLVTSADTRFLTPVAAAIGLDRRDVEAQPLVKQLFDASARPEMLGTDQAADLKPDKVEAIFLTDAVRKELHLTDADVGKADVILHGARFRYGGIISDALAGYSLLEGSSMLPVDYQASGGGSLDTFTQQTETESLNELPDIESAQFVNYNVDRVVVISPGAARRLQGRIRALTVYPHGNEEGTLQEIADRVSTVTEMPTYVGSAGGVYRLIFTSLARASGWRDLLIPVVLGGLIVFATMLGSVSDREKEIYTFSSLGLAPPHVASLFFAEASVYAVIGGMGGYLLGQLVARLLSWLSGIWDFSVPTMNYSSTNAIVTILIVMGTVLISTIYPALKASRSANPGIQRHWKIPAPQANLYDLVFPFTVSAYDITGVVSFLREHFENYSDTSLGVFATTESHVFRQRDMDMLGISATVALAPFDLGVNQRFALLSQPSDIEGIDEVRILIYRLSGANGDWRRSNRVFINDLRKQLLIWRSLPPEIMERYRQKTLERWDQLPREQVDAETIGDTA